MKRFYKKLFEFVEKHRLKTTWPGPDFAFSFGRGLANWLKEKSK